MECIGRYRKGSARKGADRKIKDGNGSRGWTSNVGKSTAMESIGMAVAERTAQQSKALEGSGDNRLGRDRQHRTGVGRMGVASSEL